MTRESSTDDCYPQIRVIDSDEAIELWDLIDLELVRGYLYRDGEVWVYVEDLTRHRELRRLVRARLEDAVRQADECF